MAVETTSAMIKASPRRSGWWKRSLNKRIESFLEAQVGKATATGQFFRSGTSAADPIDDVDESRFCLVDRSEVVLGDLLGQGAFSEVYELSAIVREDSSVDSDSDSDTDSDSESDTEDVERRTSPVSPSSSSSGSPHLVARDANGRCRYAVKHLQKSLQGDRAKFQDAAARLILEAKFLSRLEHPNIIGIRGWACGETASYSNGSHDGFFLILDRIDETMTQRIQRWKRGEQAGSSLRSKLAFGLRIASALEYMHSRRLIYRDLKPCNVGIAGDNDTIKLIDFGLCRELPEQPERCNSDGDNEIENCISSGMRDGTFLMTGRVGTRRYMAPEVFMRRAYNQAADVYSWSILLFEMLSLHPSIDVGNDMLHEMLVCNEGVRPVMDDSWPATVQELLRLCWQSDIADRLTMADVCDILRRMLDMPSPH